MDRFPAQPKWEISVKRDTMNTQSSVLLIATVIICLGQGVFGAEFPCHYPKTTEPPGQHFPYVATNYQEDYRGQFHFSAQNGHINDVNGPILIDGVYHLYYQHYPYCIHSVHSQELQANGKGYWGHATSTDLMHWTQEAVALDAHHNPGGEHSPQMYSGTSAIDWKNTSGLKKGKNDVIIIMYTAFGYTPNMLAFSNDNGWTWENYKGNAPSPGGILEDGERDPKIFWYEPTKQWILNIFDDNPTPYSSSFYSSPDLKNWTYKSSFGAGQVYECTDMYEIRVDGNPKNKRWVFSDAGTRYWIGEFDGTKFDATEVTKKQPMELLCPTGEVYAGLVWGNLPDDRVVYQGWLKSQALTDAALAAGQEVRWEHELTFPWEIKLKTYPEGMRLTRNPIAEIANLYTSTSKWRNKTITKTSKNLLTKKKSKCYRITAVFDLTDSTATKFGFGLHQNSTSTQRNVTYNVTESKLDGYSMPPENNKVKIDILVDWGQLEIFGNHGKLSLAYTVPWDKNVLGMSLWSDGKVKLESLEYHDIASTWYANNVPLTPYDGLTAVSMLTGVSWSSKSGLNLTKQKVYFGTNPDKLKKVANGDGTLKALNNASLGGLLKPLTTYYWKVDGENTAGSKRFPGKVWSFTTEEIKVVNSSPINKTTGVKDTTLAWDGFASAVSYNVYLGKTAESLVKVGKVLSETYLAKELSAGTWYYWQVKALDARGKPIVVGPVTSFRTAPNVRPDAISVNFHGGNTLDAGDFTGAPSYEASNWNNVRVISGRLAPGSVKDGSGGILPKVTVAWKASKSFAPHFPVDPASPGDKKLWDHAFLAESNQSGEVTITNIPYDKYDVIMYISSNYPKRGAQITVAGPGITYVALPPSGSLNNQGFDGVYVPAISTDPENPTKDANYSVHKGLTNSTCKIDWTPLTGAGMEHGEGWVVGFQIVRQTK